MNQTTNPFDSLKTGGKQGLIWGLKLFISILLLTLIYHIMTPLLGEMITGRITGVTLGIILIISAINLFR